MRGASLVSPEEPGDMVAGREVSPPVIAVAWPEAHA